MKKIVCILFVLLTSMSTSVFAQSIGVFTWDSKGKYTNVRNAPGGKVVDRIPTNVPAMIGVKEPTNGWWKLVDNEYDTGDEQGKLKGSTTGYWIHYSVLAMGTRNYGNQKLTLRKSPNAKAAAVYSFAKEILLRPREIKDDWVKVQTIDGKYTGWIEEEWLCGNALTNCC